MESISERERPVRHWRDHVTVIRTVIRVLVWIAVLLAALGVLARMTLT